MSWSTKEPDIQTLSRDALHLLRLDIDELYLVLGCQLLASAPPTRAMTIVGYVRKLRLVGKQRGNLAPDATNSEALTRIEEICTALKSDGLSFIEAMRKEFKQGLCNKEIIELAKNTDEAKMQILIMVISAILKLPARFDPISATLAAMFCKSLLKDICR